MRRGRTAAGRVTRVASSAVLVTAALWTAGGNACAACHEGITHAQPAMRASHMRSLPWGITHAQPVMGHQALAMPARGHQVLAMPGGRQHQSDFSFPVLPATAPQLPAVDSSTRGKDHRATQGSAALMNCAATDFLAERRLQHARAVRGHANQGIRQPAGDHTWGQAGRDSRRTHRAHTVARRTPPACSSMQHEGHRGTQGKAGRRSPGWRGSRPCVVAPPTPAGCCRAAQPPVAQWECRRQLQRTTPLYSTASSPMLTTQSTLRNSAQHMPT